MFSVLDLLALSQVQGIGPHRLRSLVSRFGDPSSVLQASAKEIAEVEGFSRKLASLLAHHLRDSALAEERRYAERQLSRLNRAGGHLVTFWDKRYPEALKKIYDPPPFLFVRGEIIEDDRYAIALVGTRMPSEYGSAVAERFSQEIARLGITAVSGMARGIDTIVHGSALKAGGRTLAVIGSGIDVCYPPENRALSDRIATRGAVISEYEMGAKPDAVNFPRRNRIISGVSLGTLVIETDVDGGAMITASTALDQNREVFAIPGNITDKRARGCNALIKDGRAKLVEQIDDIIDELATKLRPLLKDAKRGESRPLPDLSLFERSILDVLSDTPVQIDAIAERCRTSTADALVHLLSLEFKGAVRQLPGKMFVKL